MSEELKPLSKKHQMVQDEYLTCWNQTEAYEKVYPSASHASAKASAARLFTDVNFLAHLQARLDEIHMSVDEALQRETEIGRVGVGFFFRITDDWMFNPLPEYEILDEKEVIEEGKNGEEVKRIAYRVRHAVLDMDKVMDPRYAYLVKKFANSRRTGLSIEMYDGQISRRDVLRINKKLKDGVNVNLTWKEFISGGNGDAGTDSK